MQTGRGHSYSAGAADQKGGIDDELGLLLLRISRFHAVRMGLSQEEAEDCALGFVERMLVDNRHALQNVLPRHCFSAWLHQCARNFARNFCRARTVRRQHEFAWPDTPDSERVDSPGDAMDGAPPPEMELLHQEFWQRVTIALERLPPIMRDLLIRHHLHDECIKDLAASSGRTPRAVEQTLFRARRRLRGLLERMGLTEPELRAYIIGSSGLEGECLHSLASTGTSRRATVVKNNP